MNYLKIGIIILVLALGGVFLFTKEKENYHVHADFQVILNGSRVDFSDEKYMTEGSFLLHKYVHLHDGDADVIHIHSKDVVLGDFFRSLGYSLNSTCFSTDAGAQYCNSASGQLTMLVNGKPNTEFNSYSPHDLDRILIFYGDPSGASTAFSLLTNKACIQSGTCPERGDPYNESMSCGPGSFCVG